MIETQSSQLLPFLFEHVDEDRRLTVLHLGPALPETIEFFSRYRSKLYFCDLFAELPLTLEEGDEVPLREQLTALLDLPPGMRFDLCLIWDLLNFLDAQWLAGLQDILRSHLHPASMTHGFAAHNPRIRPADRLYAIRESNQLAVRERPAPLPGYVAHGQGSLKTLLSQFEFGRTVLLPDKRLEFLLSVKR
jgi:hypothetical protein